MDIVQFKSQTSADAENGSAVILSGDVPVYVRGEDPDNYLSTSVIFGLESLALILFLLLIMDWGHIPLYSAFFTWPAALSAVVSAAVDFIYSTRKSERHEEAKSHVNLKRTCFLLFSLILIVITKVYLIFMLGHRLQQIFDKVGSLNYFLRVYAGDLEYEREFKTKYLGFDVAAISLLAIASLIPKELAKPTTSAAADFETLLGYIDSVVAACFIFFQRLIFYSKYDDEFFPHALGNLPFLYVALACLRFIGSPCRNNEDRQKGDEEQFRRDPLGNRVSHIFHTILFLSSAIVLFAYYWYPVKLFQFFIYCALAERVVYWWINKRQMDRKPRQASK